MAIIFDGTDDFVQLANESNYDFDHDDTFSIAFWVKTSTDQTAALISKLQNLGTIPGSFEVQQLTGTGVIRFVIVSSFPTDNILVTHNVDISDGEWHFIVCTYDGSTNASGALIYVDTIENSSIIFDNLDPGDSILNNVPVRLGIRDGNNLPFEGSLDDVTIYNAVLTQADINLIYNWELKFKTKEVKESNIVTYLALDGEIGTSADGVTLPDYSGNDNTATGDDGANNTGLTFEAGILSYPGVPIYFRQEVGSSPSGSPSASPSASVSPSASPSISPSSSLSASPSSSPSFSPSISPSSSPSISPSFSPSVSPSASESASPSLSPSVSLSVSPSASPSSTPSISPSASLSSSPSVSPSASLSASVSPSVSPSASPSPSGIINLFQTKLKNITDYGKLKNTTDYGQLKRIG